MNRKQKISQSGGSLSIGGIVQGDNNQVNIDARNATIKSACDEAQQKAAQIGEELKKTQVEIDAVVAHLAQLDAEATSDTPAPSKGKAILDTIRQNFSWAYPVAKDFISIAWPVLLGALGH